MSIYVTGHFFYMEKSVIFPWRYLTSSIPIFCFFSCLFFFSSCSFAGLFFHSSLLLFLTSFQVLRHFEFPVIDYWNLQNFLLWNFNSFAAIEKKVVENTAKSIKKAALAKFCVLVPKWMLHISNYCSCLLLPWLQQCFSCKK